MTTIAYDGEIIACDSIVCSNSEIISMDSKKVKLLGGVYHIAAGRLSERYMMEDYINGVNICQPDVDDITSWIICSKGIYLYDNGYFMKLGDKYTKFATGSGGDYALGALDNGANAIKAVEIACKRDTGSGGEIKHYNVHPLDDFETIDNHKHLKLVD